MSQFGKINEVVMKKFGGITAARLNKKADNKTYNELNTKTYWHQVEDFTQTQLEKAVYFETANPMNKKCKHEACRLKEWQGGNCYLHFLKSEEVIINEVL